MPRNKENIEPSDFEAEVPKLEQAQGISTQEKEYLSRSFSQDFEEVNQRPLDKMFVKPGEEMREFNSTKLVDQRMLSRIHGMSQREAQEHLVSMYEQQMDKVFEVNGPTDEARKTYRLLARDSTSLDEKWEKKKKFLKEYLRARVEQQWALVEKNNQGDVRFKAHEAQLLQDDHEKLKRLGIEHISLNEKTASAKDMPVSVKLSKGFRGSRLGKAAEIRVDSAIAERPDYSDQVIALGRRIHELDRQLEDARKEGTGFFGFGKGKKDQKIADLEAQKAEFILQKQQAEQAQEQVKVFERAIKDVNGFLEKVNNSLFSDDNFKTDKIEEAKTLGQFIEVLNTELQRLGQTQLTTEQVAAKKLVDSTEERLQNAQEKLKEMERQVAQREAYRDMSYKSVLPEYAR